MTVQEVKFDLLASVTSKINVGLISYVDPTPRVARVGDVVAVRALNESRSYGMLETPSGRLARIKKGGVICGVLGERRALKGIVGEVPPFIGEGDRLSILNLGGVIGQKTGVSSSLGAVVDVEVIGTVCDAVGKVLNIAASALPTADEIAPSAPVVLVAGTCMNSGKTVAVAEIIREAALRGLKVAGVKLTGVACLRDTLEMQDNGAFATVSFLDFGLPSTVGHADLEKVAIGAFNHLNSLSPDLIVAELGDGVLGGYSVERLLASSKVMGAVKKIVFCASDFVGIVGGVTVLNEFGLQPDVISGSVTDSTMGENAIRERFRIAAANARSDSARLFSLTTDIPVQVLEAAVC
ncbi:MAG TPA: hypothetical protein PLR83_03430 [Pyrinomonadaceae bacterium]|nr:hypothetical protein [Pyrinomonadaceae bacterium]